MRDVLAVAGVILLALCLGVTAAYLSVDLTPPGLELIRPPKPEVARQIEREQKQSIIQAEASACKYCVAVAELAQTFARHAKSARQHATALQSAVGLESKGASPEVQLRTAERSADSAEAAAAALTSWASKCKAEDFCQAPAKRVSASACVNSANGSVATALLLANAVRKSARVCTESACPSVDCKATSELKSEVQNVERSLSASGGRFSVAVAGQAAARLAVGASTFKAELKRVGDEAVYVTKMLPLMLDSARVNASNGHLPKLASEMVEERAVSAAQLALDMERSSAVGDSLSDPRNEAAWRLKSLAVNLSELGRETQPLGDSSIDWQKATDALGAALFDLARLQAMLDRVSDVSGDVSGCDASAPAAAQQLREAVAMLDLCRMRSACSARGRYTVAAQTNKEDAASVASRALARAEQLIVNEIGSTELATTTVNDQILRPIDALRSQQGVCVRAAEMRDASTIAPAAAQSLVQTVTPTLQPAIGPVAPQDLVTGAINAAATAPVQARDADGMTVEASAPPASVQPSGGPEVLPAAGSVPDAPPAFTGNMLTQSGPAFVAGEEAPGVAPPAKQK